MISVRPYGRTELPAIIANAGESALAQLVARDLPEGTPQAVATAMQRMYEDVLRVPLSALLVAEAGPGNVAGYALLLPQGNGFTGGRELVVMDLFTRPALRGQGVGKALLAHADAYGRSIGCVSIAAQVALHNGVSLTVFKRAGFLEERLVVGKRL